MGSVRVVMSGAGAAGSAILRVLLEAGVRDVVVADIEGVIHRDRPDLHDSLRWLAEATNGADVGGSLRDALVGADVFIGVSAPDLLDGGDIATMAEDAIVFALANPVPEVDPAQARRHAAVVATGRSDYPNQINNVLAFPGVFRGLLDASATSIDNSVLVAAAEAVAGAVSGEELNAEYIIPSVFHPEVHGAVAAAVRRAAEEAGIQAPGAEEVPEVPTIEARAGGQPGGQPGGHGGLSGGASA
jgi:malate dehydrogenase (oxaloacetate-decarboxylating)